MRTNSILTPCKQGAVLSRHSHISTNMTIELAAEGCVETRKPQASVET